MPYCTATDIYLEAGTSTGTASIADIGNMITRSDEEIVAILAIRGISAPSSAALLKTASVSLTIARLKRRMAQELSRPNSLSLGGDISFSVSGEAEAQAYEAKARVAIDQYASSINGRFGVRTTTGGL